MSTLRTKANYIIYLYEPLGLNMCGYMTVICPLVLFCNLKPNLCVVSKRYWAPEQRVSHVKHNTTEDVLASQHQCIQFMEYHR